MENGLDPDNSLDGGLKLYNGLDQENISGSSSSDNSDNCLICFETVGNEEYCKIDHPGESKPIYHRDCIDKWLNDNRKGLFTKDTISKYNIYKNGLLFQTVVLERLEPENLREVVIEIPHNGNTGYNNHNRTFSVTNMCMCLCIVIVLYVILSLVKI